jgi:rod shape-determining protein MreC
MKNLIRFIIVNGYPLVFLFFQFIAFYIILNNNYFQQSAFYQIGSNFTGKISEQQAKITDYLSLAEANLELSEENAKLYNTSKSSFMVVNKEFSIINDTLNKVKYRYAPAKVINSTFSKTYNFLTLNKGSINGFKENMGVINEKGLVGILTSISNNYAIVLPIIHPKSLFSVMLKEKHYFGLLKWDGKKHTISKMTDVSNHAILAIGDTIITRETTIFPEGIPVGVIHSFEKIKGSNFLDIDVELFVDFSKIYHVYCIENLIADEQKNLENTTIE